MPTFDLQTAEVLVFTFKEGALAAMAHDLKLRFRRGTITVDGAQVRATVEAASLAVVCPRKAGQDAPGVLPELLYGEIEKNAAKDVLEVSRFPEVRFESTAVDAGTVRGRLTLHGVTREIAAARTDDATSSLARFELDQRDFGITPYKAMLGTLKVKPKLEITVRLPRLS
ncbi:MAG: YceI family protein [Myxococcaceae bacterium]|nr:YceI family protein [Myxococcaceae bacterium]